MASAQTPRYSLTELAGLAGVTPRTVRYYVSQGLLPSPGAVGPGAKYDDGHLDRLRLIRRLQREHLPLAEIRGRLANLDDATIASLAEAPPALAEDSALDYIRRVLAPKQALAAAPQPAAAPPARAMLAREFAGAPPAFAPPRHLLRSMPAPEPATPPPLERAQWERITLAPDIELHVRRPLQRPLSKKVDRLVSVARELLEEDPS
jgi:DNA-binding transcriptional MerR regulator